MLVPLGFKVVAAQDIEWSKDNPPSVCWELLSPNPSYLKDLASFCLKVTEKKQNQNQNQCSKAGHTGVGQEVPLGNASIPL